MRTTEMLRRYPIGLATLTLAACGGGSLEPDALGALFAVMRTRGASAATKYTVRVAETGATRDALANDSILIGAVPAGTYNLQLSGVPPGCAADSGTARTVVVRAGSISGGTFGVVCGLVGAIRVSVQTELWYFAVVPQSYGVWLDSVAVARITPDGTLLLTPVPIGRHTVRLLGSAARTNCRPGTSDTIETEFHVICGVP
jgi:hypothetical protein